MRLSNSWFPKSIRVQHSRIKIFYTPLKFKNSFFFRTYQFDYGFQVAKKIS